MSDGQVESIQTPKPDSAPKSPYVFVSHDTRDAEIAEAFAKLLSSVTAGVLKCFRSSDRKGSQGIEYGVEWFPELMRRLQDATDVVCLLTMNSINRPWILFEAGVAKGKLNTPILGMAVGVPLVTASSGPFAQFQNSDDEENSLVKLVIQLVKKIPGAEPDDGVVRQQVLAFKSRVAELIKKQLPEKPVETKKESESAAPVAKLVEEVKVMFNDLPNRLMEIQGPISKRRRSRRFHPAMIEEVLSLGRHHSSPLVGFSMLLATVREDFPWINDLGRQIIAAARRNQENDMTELVMQFHELVEMSYRHPGLRDLWYGNGDLDSEEFRGMLHTLADHSLDFAKSKRK